MPCLFISHLSYPRNRNPLSTPGRSYESALPHPLFTGLNERRVRGQKTTTEDSRFGLTYDFCLRVPPVEGPVFLPPSSPTPLRRSFRLLEFESESRTLTTSLFASFTYLRLLGGRNNNVVDLTSCTGLTTGPTPQE